MQGTASYGLSLKYVTFFGPISTSLPRHTFSHISGPLKYVTHLGPPIFSSTKNPDKNLLYNISFNCLRGSCPGILCLEGFVRGGFCPFLLRSEYFRYNRKLNITFNFSFHIYDKKFKSVMS